MHKIALIGYGYWGKRFLRYLEEQFDVAYICHRNADESGRFTSNIEKVFKSDVETVVIATPIDTHYGIAKAALECGKHVLCEKPLSRSEFEIMDLMDIAQRSRLHLVTEFTYTFSRSLNLAHELVRDGKIGRLVAVDLSLRHVGRFLTFNVYWLLATHMLAVLDMFVDIESCSFKQFDLIPNETAVILFNNDTIAGQITVSLNYPDREARVVLYGEEGTVVYNAFDEVTLRVGTYLKTPGAPSDSLIKDQQGFNYDERNNLALAARYFRDVLDGSIDAFKNSRRAIAVTRTLEKLGV